MTVGLLYPNWRLFPDSKLEFAMDVVGMELALRLAGRGVGVTLYSQGGQLRGSTVVESGVEHRRLPRLFDVGSRLIHQQERLLKLRRGQRHVLRSAPILYKLPYGLMAAHDLRNRRIDIAHVHILDQFIPIVRRFAPQTKIVFHMHDHKQVFRDRERTLARLRQADAIVGCSAFTTAAVSRRFPELADRCHPVLNAVDVDLFTSSETSDRRAGGKTILFVGRLSPEKGVHTLLDAFERLLGRHPDSELRIVGPRSVAPLADVDPARSDPRFSGLYSFFGEGPDGYGRYLEDRLSAAARPRVRFIESVSHDEMPRQFRESDLVVFPSLWDEPFGLPTLEGMASGRPVVATRVGGIPEVVEDGVTGLLVEPGDATQLAGAIGSLLENSEVRRSMGERARSRACSDFSWEQRIDEWIALYEGLTSPSVADPRGAATAEA